MARKGEIADIVSRKQYDYFMKQLKSVLSRGKSKSVKPLDNRGQPHRAKRDQRGRVIEPGGGPADPPPTAKQAYLALKKFHDSGKTRDSLPEVSTTRNAIRKDMEHAKMRRDNVIRPAIRPPGSASYEKELRHRQRLNASKEYLSKSINEEFLTKLNELLGT